MEYSSQEKNPLVEMIKQAISIKKWKQNKLAKASGVAQPVISRLLNGSSNISIDNIYNILNCLDILQIKKGVHEQQDQYSFMCGWPDEHIELCKALKNILDSGDKIAIAAILSNIAAFSDSVKRKIRIDELEKDVRELKKFNAGLSSEDRPKNIGKKRTM
jgi:transcriptional regulator with XRE-family HTH domain